MPHIWGIALYKNGANVHAHAVYENEVNGFNFFFSASVRAWHGLRYSIYQCYPSIVSKYNCVAKFLDILRWIVATLKYINLDFK